MMYKSIFHKRRMKGFTLQLWDVKRFIIYLFDAKKIDVFGLFNVNLF